MASRQSSTWAVRLLLTSALFLLGGSPAQDPECLPEAPLYSLSWASIPLGTSPQPLGEWRLPRSHRDPNRLTQARAAAELFWEPDSNSWEMHVHFSYPVQLGIFYSFQRMKLEWEGADGPQAALQDFVCPGRDLIPGGGWMVKFNVPGSAGLSVLKNVRLTFWGGQN